MINNAEWHGASRVNAVRQTVTNPESRKERKYIMFDYNNRHCSPEEAAALRKKHPVRRSPCAGCKYLDDEMCCDHYDIAHRNRNADGSYSPCSHYCPRED